MGITLCMTVRNEARKIQRCLDSAIPWVNQILIADTGSTDETVKLISKNYGVPVFRRPLETSRCLTLSDARNFLIAQAKHDWILTLDADEILKVKSGYLFSELLADQSISGYFAAWINNPSLDEEFRDYKLFLFRKELRMCGLVHSSVTPDLRAKGLIASWQECAEIVHGDNVGSNKRKHPLRKKRLLCAINKEPEWNRYHWFLGYTYFIEGEYRMAEPYLKQAFQDQTGLFPVEAICAGAILVYLLLTELKVKEAKEVMTKLKALIFINKEDFEIVPNWRVVQWINDVSSAFELGLPAVAPPPRFAY